NDGSVMRELAELPPTSSMTPVTLSLAEYEGQVIRLQFLFDTGNADSNGFEGWVVDDVEVVAATRNLRPIAVAGPDQEVQPGTQVTLDGSASSDPEGQPLSYEWRDLAGVVVGTTAVLTLTPAPGMHEFTLTVKDGELEASDSVRVRVLGGKRVTLSVASAESGRGTVWFDPPAPACSNE